MLGFANEMFVLGLGGAFLLFIVLMIIVVKCYRKVSQGQAIIRNGVGGTRVSFSGMVVWPIIHRAEYMDVSVKRIEIDRGGAQGLVCQDNLRADIKVAFFVRVNNTVQDVMKVAQALGCVRASDERALYDLFDAKFSEGLKTVGKRFDFSDLYTERVKFKEEILQVVGTDLNGYVLEDAAIDYLEQTDKKLLNPDNILDAEGIKKITVLTAEQFEMANSREREKDKTITRQNVEAQESILQLNRQLAEAQAKQKREVESAVAREDAEAKRVIATEREKAEKARIAADEQIAVAEENKLRQIIVAAKNKERTDGVETQRVIRDRDLEATERERLVSLAQLGRDKVVESEKKEVQNVIRERVMVEKTVVAEEQRIKDTVDFATADRSKRVAITKAEQEAEQALVKDIKAAEASKRATEFLAEQQLIEADANLKAADKNAIAKKTLAEAAVKEHAVEGVAEAQVMEARAAAIEKTGTAEARVIDVKASANEHQGTVDAKVMQLRFEADAEGIRKKAESMKLFNAVGKDHEEFKLRLAKDQTVELADINIRKDIAQQQAIVLGEALKSARIDIVGGETKFFQQLVGAIANGKSVDRLVDNSRVLTDVKNTFFDPNGDGEEFKAQLHRFVDKFGLSSEDVKNLTISALMVKMVGMADGESKGLIQGLMRSAETLGIGNKTVHELGLSNGIMARP